MPAPSYQRAPKAASTVSYARRPGGNTSRRPMSAAAAAAKKTPPVPQSMNGVSPFEIMASRIANRVAEMAENVSFVERPQYQPKQAEPEQQTNSRKPKQPRKLEIRLPNANANGVKFSAPFLDNLLAKMLSLQNRMLMTGQEIAGSDAEDKIKRDQFEQSAELSRIIALICAEKARQGVD